MERKPLIVIPVYRGHMARLMAYSGVISRLATGGANVLVLTPQGEQSSLRKLLPSENIIFEQISLSGSGLSNRWDRIYRYWFQTLLPTASSSARLQAIKTEQPLRYWLITRLPHPVMKRLERFWVNIRRLIFSADKFASNLEKYPIDLIVAGSMGRTFEDFILLRYAHTKNIHTLCTVQSWDTLTTKEFDFELPDRLTVWNPANRQTAIDLFHYEKDDVAIVGVPQFDYYFERASYETRSQWFSHFGLDPARELLFVTGQGGHVHRNLQEVLETLATGIANNSFIKPVQVLVRPHPAVYFGDVAGQGTESDLQAYEKLSPHIKCNRPVRSDTLISTDTSVSEHLVLANNLYHAAMLIDFYGTLAVEACVMDRPVIYADVRSSFGYAPNQSVRSTHRGIDYRDYEHLKYVFSMDGAKTAYNSVELINFINRYLRDPSLESAGRKAITNAFCYKSDGKASERLASVILNFSNGVWEQN